MAYVFNWLTGVLDDINPSSSMSASGDFQIGNVSVSSKDLWGVKGVKYYIAGVIAPIGGEPPLGQPIPIGMGLTLLYSGGNSLTIPPINIKRGQPIPIGMGLTMTYASDVN